MKRLIIMLLWLISSQAYAAAFVASVDRTQLSEDETVVLTLESTDPTLFGRPDLSPLDKDFDVLGSRQINQLTSISGAQQASTRWVITLQPKITGHVEIPPISLGDAQTQAISLSVLSSGERLQNGELAPVFIEASVDRDKVYVQAQVILTLRIHHSVSLYDDSSLSALQVEDARVERLGDPRTYEKTINGVRHGVIEVRYAIFPQRSGELIVPSQVFSATQVERRANNDFMNFGIRQGKLTRVRSPNITLEVMPKPASYPENAPWLPARALALSQSWNPEPNNLVVGESLTRSLTLSVDGLSSAQLPPLPATEVDGLRRYPDQPQLSDNATENGIIGSREEREALVATRSGEFQLPEVKVLWWDTESDSLQSTHLPAQTLIIAENPTLTAESEPNSPTPTALSLEAPKLWPWQLACAVLTLTTLIGFGLWWHARRQPAISRSAQTGPSPRTLLDDLKRACLSGDAQATRSALDAWARQQPQTLADMAARYVPLSAALDELNAALYSETAQQWQGEQLWKAIRSLPATEELNVSSAEASPLPPLYPR